MFGHFACLVRLQRTDEMPFHVPVLELTDFFQRLLHVVFAKAPLPELVQGGDSSHRVALADGQDPNLGRVPIRRLAGFFDP